MDKKDFLIMVLIGFVAFQGVFILAATTEGFAGEKYRWKLQPVCELSDKDC